MSPNWYYRFIRNGKTSIGSTGTKNKQKATKFEAAKLEAVEQKQKEGQLSNPLTPVDLNPRINSIYLDVRQIVMRRALPACLFIFCIYTDPAASGEVAALAPDQNGCMIEWGWNGPPQPMTFDGQCQDGLASGVGTESWHSAEGNLRAIHGTWQNGILQDGPFDRDDSTGHFEGMRVNHEIVGLGKQSFSSGAEYVGNFKHARPMGPGTFRNSKGDVFTGEFAGSYLDLTGTDQSKAGVLWEGIIREGVLEGHGKATSKGGSIEGNYVKGIVQDGIQIMNFANGDRYEGTMIDGKYGGLGKLTLVSMARPDRGTLVLDGEFHNDKLNGPGKAAFSSGSYEVGTFVDNELEGNGLFHIEGKGDLSGEFHNGKLNGQGVRTGPTGGRISGTFVDGKLNGYAKWQFPNGMIEEGQFLNLRLNGYGSIALPNGTHFEGQFLDGKLNGLGKITAPNGNSLSGIFSDFKISGQGDIKLITGNRCSATFYNDVMIGTRHCDDGSGVNKSAPVLDTEPTNSQVAELLSIAATKPPVVDFSAADLAAFPSLSRGPEE